jgi:thiopeptide-type bacteriocin biosynthesis protein
MRQLQSTFKQAYRALGACLVRTPMFSIENLADANALHNRNDLFRFAIATSSPSLFAAVSKKEHRSSDVDIKLRKYFKRMHTRPTPYGVFAGTAIANFGSQTTLRLLNSVHRRRTRLDMEVVYELIDAIESNYIVRQGLPFRTASDIRFQGDRAILLEKHSASALGGKTHSTVRATTLVREILHLCRESVVLSELKRNFYIRAEGQDSLVDQVIDGLCEEGFLVCDIWPPLNCGSPTKYLEFALDKSGLEENKQVIDWLRMTEKRLALIDELAPEEATPFFADIRHHVGTAPISGKPRAAYLTQTDLSIQTSGVVGEEVAQRARKLGELLLSMTSAPEGPSNLQVYRRAFQGRFDEEQEVPLLDMIDREVGIGPTSDYQAIPAVNDSRRDKLLLELLSEAIASDKISVELTKQQVELLRTVKRDASRLPLSFDINCIIDAPSIGALNAGAFKTIVGPNVGVVGAGRTFARFADLLGHEAENLLIEIAESEQSLFDGVIAEAVYTPKKRRMANVMIRPACRGWESYHSTASRPNGAMDVALNDLQVGVRRNRFYVRWLKTGELVRFVCGHMLNIQQAPDSLRTLVDISQDGEPLLHRFDWGICESSSFLPRIEFEQLILRVAEWRLSPIDINRLLRLDVDKFREALVNFHFPVKLPFSFYYCDNDNRLLIDLRELDDLELLRDELKRARPKSFAVLQEVLPSLDRCWLDGPGGKFACELVVPCVQFKKNAEVLTKTPNETTDFFSSTDCRKYKVPGSEWLYVQAECHRDVELDVIKRFFPEILRLLRLSELLTDWHFVRYRDPKSQIRIRFKLQCPREAYAAMAAVGDWCRQLQEGGFFLNFRFATYVREIERYGGFDSMEVCEKIHSISSDGVLLQLALHPTAVREIDEVEAAIVSTHFFLSGMGFTSAEQISWLKEYCFEDRRKSGGEYRKKHMRLRQLMLGAALDNRLIPNELADIFKSMRSSLACQEKLLKASQVRVNRSRSFGQIVSVLVHMHLNRLLGIDAEKESVVKGLLCRALESIESRVE